MAAENELEALKIEYKKKNKKRTKQDKTCCIIVNGHYDEWEGSRNYGRFVKTEFKNAKLIGNWIHLAKGRKKKANGSRIYFDKKMNIEKAYEYLDLTDIRLANYWGTTIDEIRKVGYIEYISRLTSLTHDELSILKQWRR